MLLFIFTFFPFKIKFTKIIQIRKFDFKQIAILIKETQT
jgi:hypothetical protein